MIAPSYRRGAPQLQIRGCLYSYPRPILIVSPTFYYITYCVVILGIQGLRSWLAILYTLDTKRKVNTRHSSNFKVSYPNIWFSRGPSTGMKL